MDASNAAQEARLCAHCIEARTRFLQNSFNRRHSTPPSPSQTSNTRRRSMLHSGRLNSALNARWQLLLQSTLLFIVLLRTGLCEASCHIGDPYVGYFPNVRDSQLKLQHSTSAAHCATTCCLKRYCDLAWVVEDGCFHARCQRRDDCVPLLGTDMTSIVHVMDRSSDRPQKDGLTPCNPYDEYDTCPLLEHCKFDHCVCNADTVRSPVTGRCHAQYSETWDKSVAGDGLGKDEHRKSYDPDDQYGDTWEEGVDPSETEAGAPNPDTKPVSDPYRLCDSEDGCGASEVCFRLRHFGAGICKCKDGYRKSTQLDACIAETPQGELTPPTSVGRSPEPSPTASSENPPTTATTTPNTSPEMFPETPLDKASPAAGENLTDKTTPANNNLSTLPGEDAGNQTWAVTTGKQGGGGSPGDEVPVTAGTGTSPDGEVALPHKKNDGEGSGHQGDSQVSTPAKDAGRPNATVPPTPLADNPTQEGSTQTDSTGQTLTEKDLDIEEKSKVPTHPTTKPTVVKLTVSAGEDKVLQLPDQDGVILIAYVIPEQPLEGQKYTYDWQVLETPDDSQPGKMVGEHAKELQLDQLSAGVYKFRVEVQGEGSYGSAAVNVTVIPPPRVNVAPKAVITPTNQDVILPNPDTFLDGSDSTDDDKIVSYQWQEVEGPVRETKITGDTQTLKLTDLVQGAYVIRLTVTDSDGVKDSALANVTVREEIDNPPIAKAGKDVIIKLPVDSAVLYGNSSFDDHPGLVYEWSKVSGPVADMSGSSSAILRLNNLEEGTYVFRLTVTDSKERKDSDEATVIVKAENNLPPTADAGPDKELSLPDESTTLNGKESTDDLAVTSYLWEKVSGPNDPEIKDSETEVATVSGLVAGQYIFKLTVGDKQGDTDSDMVQVVVKKEINIAPVAVAGPDITIRLPNNVVELDGSMSTDDKGIVSYEWKRDPKSPAAGTAVGNSAHEPVLKLTSLVAGIYHMTLNVTDAKGTSNTDTAVVTVVTDPHRLNLVEITFDVPVSKFNEQDKMDMARSLAVLLSVRDEDINMQQIYQTPNEQLQVIFYATNATSKTAIPGPTVVKILAKKKLSSETNLLKFRVLEVDTMICQKNCSGHGVCNPYTRLCICESFWMENYFRRWLGDGDTNCDWSILYVIIVACVIAVAFGGLCWICICCIKRSRRKVKRRRRYNLLSQDLDGTESMEMLPKNGNGKQSSSIMISESDDDTDEETTLFDSKKRPMKNGKANGSVMNAPSRKKRPFPLISSRTEKL